jgi:hypothetical protein
MRPVRFLPLLILSGALAHGGAAFAQSQPFDPMATASSGRGNYGGGFIEMLMTGRDPTPMGRGGAVYNRPGAYATYGRSTQAAAGYSGTTPSRLRLKPARPAAAWRRSASPSRCAAADRARYRSALPQAGGRL